MMNPYDSIPERLHNCPNCGGTLQDDGKCRFCGSVVYDFLGIDLDKRAPTYVRMMLDGKIVHFKAVFDNIDVKMHRGCSTLYMNNEPTMMAESIVSFEGSVDFTIVGGIIVEDPKITGVGG